MKPLQFAEAAIIAKQLGQLLNERAFESVHLIDALITEDCNCRCDYCFIEGKHPQRMTEDIVKATVDFLLLKSRHSRSVELLFLGGEPLMAFDLMQLTVEYGVYENEGHGFYRPENRLDFYRRAEKFLAKHLGGRCEE